MVELLDQDPLDGVGIVGGNRGNDLPTEGDLERHRLMRSCGVKVRPVLEVAGTPDTPSAPNGLSGRLFTDRIELYGILSLPTGNSAG
jgi:hypothetical protein